MQDDTVRLLNECHFGAKMAVTAIDTVLQSVQDPELRGRLQCSRSDHEVLVQETGRILEKSGRDARDPSPMLRKMARARTSVRMRLHPTDSTAAVLLSNGCHMGTQLLAKRLNRLPCADVQSRDAARRLIGIEDALTGSMRPYL